MKRKASAGETDPHQASRFKAPPSLLLTVACLFIGSPFPAEAQPATNGNDAVYLLITTNSLSAAFQPLVDRRTAQGKTGKLVTTDWISTNCDGTRPDGGTDLQTKIRNCIKDYYAYHGTRWVALGGDDTIIPVRYCYCSGSGDTNYDSHLPADCYYADTDGGSWDANTNGVYGEVQDITAKELTPEVCIGRIPVSTAQQATDYFNKVVRYETAQPNGFANSIMFFCPDIDPETGNQRSACYRIHDPVANGDYGYTSWYWTNIQPYWQAVPMLQFFVSHTTWDQNDWGDYGLTREHLIEKLNIGCHHIAYSGHAVCWAYVLDPLGNLGREPFYSSDAYALTNAIPFIFNSGGCEVNWFDGCLSLGNGFVLNPNGGAVVFLGCSRSTYGWAYPYRDRMDELMFQEHHETVGATFMRLKVEAACASTNCPYGHYCYNLLGDPAVVYLPNESGRRLQVFMPGGLEQYDLGMDITIRWNAAGTGFATNELVRLEYSCDSGTNWQPIPGAGGLPYNGMAFVWTNPPAISADHYRVRVTSLTALDVSSTSRKDFSIHPLALLTVRSTPFSSLPIIGSHPNTTDYTHTARIGEPATLNAPPSVFKLAFHQWVGQNGSVLSTTTNLSFLVTTDQVLVAEYSYHGPTNHYYVNDDVPDGAIAAGNDANNGQSQQAPMRHVQSLVNLYPRVGYGDILHVAPGLYQENLSLSITNSGLTLLGSGASQTILDGQSQSNCVWIDGAIGFSMSAFTVQNGLAYCGAGVHIRNNAEVTLRENVFTNNTASSAGSGWGGAVYVDTSTATLQTNQFTSSTALYAGGTVCLWNAPNCVIQGNRIANGISSSGGGIGFYYSTNVVLRNNAFTNNSALTGYGQGGAIHMNNGSTALIQNNEFRGNTALNRGGNIAIENSSSCIIWSNMIANGTSQLGGGICAWGQSVVTICSNQVVGNVASNAGWGGGIYVNSSTAMIASNLIADNRAFFRGGGICLFIANGVQVRNNMIRGNGNLRGDATDTEYGGGVGVLAAPGAGLFNNLIVDNSAINGGGVSVSSSPGLQLVNCTIAGNRASSAGGSLWLGSATTAMVLNCILWSNSAPASPEILATGLTNLTVNFCDVAGGWPGQSNTIANPLFVRDPNDGGDGWGVGGNDDFGDLHLQAASPCIDAGDLSRNYLGQTDLDGAARVIAGRVDMGAYETQLIRDTDADGLPDWWMVYYFGHPTGQPGDLSQGQDDADGDGVSNVAEYLAGTNPKDSHSYLSITGIGLGGTNGVQIAWGSAANRLYSLQRAVAVSGGLGFTNIAEHILSTPPENVYLDATAANSPSLFYRVRVE